MYGTPGGELSRFFSLFLSGEVGSIEKNEILPGPTEMGGGRTGAWVSHVAELKWDACLGGPYQVKSHWLRRFKWEKKTAGSTSEAAWP